METERICPNCRKQLPPDVPLGLCPECLIKSGLGTAGAGTPGAAFVPAPVEEISKLFPQLEVIELIGKGGMGAVYKARQPSLDRFVALKILPPTSARDPGFAERFNREARALARLNHPNIVMVHDFGRAGELHYLLMEFVDGGNLRQVETAGRLTPEQALAIVPQICDALQYAHNEGIVHRDIKPENILLDKKGRVKITDFGIAKILGLTAEKAPLTGARDIMGTPHYMAPEQVEKPRTVDHRADIYSLGVVFYEMLTGELPLGKFAPPSQKVQVDVRLDEVVLHALEKEPELRYQQASQVKTAVENITTTAAAKSTEGTAPAADTRPASDAEAVAAEILARDYVLNIRSCLRRGWALVRSDFWALVGVSALVLVLISAVSSSGQATKSAGTTTIDTSMLGLLLYGPLMGGLYFHFLKKIRGAAVVLQTAFSGFTKAFLQLLLTSLVGGILLGLAFLCLILPGIYLLVAWKFALPLVIDQGFDFWTALKLSRTVIARHWWKFWGFLIILFLVNVAGFLCLGVGVFVTFPITVAALMFAYEDIFRGIQLAGVGWPGVAGLPGQPSVAASRKIPEPPVKGAQSPAAAQPTASLWLKAALVILVTAFLLMCGFSAFMTFSTVRSFLLAVVVATVLLFTICLLAKNSERSGFLASFLLSSLAIFGVGSFITSLMPESFASNTLLKLTPMGALSTGVNRPGAQLGASYDPYLLQTEFETLQSEIILGGVIEDLELRTQWGKQYSGGQPLSTAQTLALLKARLDIHPLRNTSVMQVRVFSAQPDEAARLANAISEAYCSHVASEAATSGATPFKVEFLERASPGLRPVRPNRAMNLLVSAFAGVVLGMTTGAVWRSWRRSSLTRNTSPPRECPQV